METATKITARFTDNGDNTIIDSKTNLVWMKEDDGIERNWEDAKKYCEKNEAKLPGTGWRLPTIEELFSIIDFSRHHPAIDPVFTKTKSDYYWSSTPYANFSGYAWVVYFSFGGVNWFGIGYDDFVRAVRQNS